MADWVPPYGTSGAGAIRACMSLHAAAVAVALVPRQQSLQSGKVRWGQVAAGLTMSIRSPAPDEDVTCHRVDGDPGFVRGIVSPGQSRGAGVDEYPQVPMSDAAQADPKVGVRVRIMLPSGDQQDPPNSRTE